MTLAAAWTLAAAMELYKLGAITDEHTGGIKLEFGSAEALAKVIRYVDACRPTWHHRSRPAPAPTSTSPPSTASNRPTRWFMPPPAEPPDVPEALSTPFWCSRTHEAFGPDGEILGQAPLYDEELLVVDVDPEAVRQARLSNPVLREEKLDLTLRETGRLLSGEEEE